MEEGTVIDYTERFDELQRLLESIQENGLQVQEFLLEDSQSVLLEISELAEGMLSELSGITEVFAQVKLYSEYACGVAIFVAVVLLVYFAYKFLRMFF